MHLKREYEAGHYGVLRRGFDLTTNSALTFPSYKVTFRLLKVLVKMQGFLLVASGLMLSPLFDVSLL